MVFTCFPANVGGEFFEVKQRWAPFLPKFSGIFSRNLGILFGFSGILPKFSTNQIFGDALAPPAPRLVHHWTQESILDHANSAKTRHILSEIHNHSRIMNTGPQSTPHLRSNDAVPAVQSPNLWGGQRILVVYRSGSLRPESCVRVSEAVSKSTGVVWSAFRNGVTVGFWTWLASPLSTVGSQVAWSHDDRRSWKSLSSADVSDSAWGVGSKVWRGHRALPTIGIFNSCVGRISRK